MCEGENTGNNIFVILILYNLNAIWKLLKYWHTSFDDKFVL